MFKTDHGIMIRDRVMIMVMIRSRNIIRISMEIIFITIVRIIFMIINIIIKIPTLKISLNKPLS